MAGVDDVGQADIGLKGDIGGVTCVARLAPPPMPIGFPIVIEQF
jgi:hypothetical protein